MKTIKHIALFMALFMPIVASAGIIQETKKFSKKALVYSLRQTSELCNFAAMAPLGMAAFTGTYLGLNTPEMMSELLKEIAEYNVTGNLVLLAAAFKVASYATDKLANYIDPAKK